MVLKLGIKRLVDEAEAEIETIDIEAAKQLLDDEDTVIMTFAISPSCGTSARYRVPFTPRGMLEFWVDRRAPITAMFFLPARNWFFLCGWLALRVGDQGRAGHGCLAGGAYRWWFHGLDGGRRSGRRSKNNGKGGLPQGRAFI